jgi:beta-phosphoglucomutase
METTNEIVGHKDNEITNEKILFFDMDGTLIDTNLTNFLAYKKAIDSITKSDYGLTYDPHKRLNRSNLKSAISDISESAYENIIKEKEKCYNDFLHKAKLNIETVNILHKYSKTNKTVLVTNCRKERAIMTLNYFELADKFTHVFFRQFSDNNEKVNKFTNAISSLGVPPWLIVAFENEEIEIADAKIAGIEIINPKIA